MRWDPKPKREYWWWFALFPTLVYTFSGREKWIWLEWYQWGDSGMVPWAVRLTGDDTQWYMSCGGDGD
jgi:RimJ/RimL family protein N-acetyltransferase